MNLSSRHQAAVYGSFKPLNMAFMVRSDRTINAVLGGDLSLNPRSERTINSPVSACEVIA